MRLFAAIDLPDDVAESLSAALPGGDRLRYVPREQWHVTLAFYGELSEPVLAELSERLGWSARRTPAFGLSLRGAGTFPAQARRGRLLWCGLAGDVEALERLAERALASGRRCGIALEERAFSPHLTLARARHDPVDLRPEVEALSAYASREWTVDELHLVQSRLGPPVSHRRLQSWPLGSSPRSAA